MVELLAGPLVGAAHVNKLAAKNWGNFVFALHPRMMGDATKFYTSAVRHTAGAEPAHRRRLPCRVGPWSV